MKLSLRQVKYFIKSIIIVILLICFFHFAPTQSASAQQTNFWPVTAIDTMKYSRDAAGDQSVLLKIPQYVQEIADLHPNYIAIDTPYDEEFYPVLRAWIDEARRNHLRVWFRGNFSGWEGWFGHAKFSDPHEHIQLTQQFISAHPELFQDGDIFSPVPEAENGVLGDPRQNGKVQEFNSFLQKSYDTCTTAFAAINKKVDCGYFSVNGDIAKQVLTPQTVANTGNRVVIDHYVDSTEKMASDLDYLHNKFPQAKIVLGEFGAPIPDINGNMNDEEQAKFVKSLLDVFVQKSSFVDGMNYWTFLGSSTELFTIDNTPKPVATLLSLYFKPPMVSGRVIDTVGHGLGEVTVKDQGKIVTTTDRNGMYTFASLPDTTITVSFTKSQYKSTTKSITVATTNITIPPVTLTSTKSSWYDNIKVFFKDFFSRK